MWHQPQVSHKHAFIYFRWFFCCPPTDDQLSYTKIKLRLFSEYVIYISLSYGFSPVGWDEEKTMLLLGNREQKTQAKSLELGLGWDTALIHRWALFSLCELWSSALVWALCCRCFCGDISKVIISNAAQAHCAWNGMWESVSPSLDWPGQDVFFPAETVFLQFKWHFGRCLMLQISYKF